MENPIKMDDLGVPLFAETSIFQGFGETHHPKVSYPPIFLKGGNDFQDFQHFGVVMLSGTYSFEKVRRTTNQKGDVT